MEKEEYIDQEYLEHWLREFGMPEENIQDCITQIAQGYGACRYLEGVQDGADAVNEIGEKAVEAAMAELDEKIKAFSEKTKGESAEQILAEMRGEEPAHPVTKTSEQDSELEKEIDRCIVDEDMGFETCARHFANWQKEQMMKEAINAIVESDLDPHGADYGLQKIKIEYMKLESLRFKPNTPVKIIILKEE